MSDKAFTKRIDVAIANRSKAAVIRTATERMARMRVTTDEFGPMDDLRDEAQRIRVSALKDLAALLDEFATNLESRGGNIFFAADAAEANQYVVDLATTNNVKSCVKGKSMVTEEIELNGALEQAGVEVLETDLGEFIVQLDNDVPSHIIAPIIHKSKEEVGALFAKELGSPFSDDPTVLNAIARKHLRQKFLDADMGVTGCNIAVADTGTVCLVENEGNGRLSSTVPPIHVVVMGMERIVKSFEEASVILSVLARSATGQSLGTYLNFVTGTDEETDGPVQLHVVILDNGRSQILGGQSAEILGCIRCGACLNACPIFQTIGGHGYGTVYSGPMGSVVTPGLHGIAPWGDLAHASTLCGACQDVCPIRIDIPKMLQEIRVQTVAEGHSPMWLGLGMKAYAKAATNPEAWAKAQRRAAGASNILNNDGSWIDSIPGPGKGWTKIRDFPKPKKETFRQKWKEQHHGT